MQTDSCIYRALNEHTEPSMNAACRKDQSLWERNEVCILSLTQIEYHWPNIFFSKQRCLPSKQRQLDLTQTLLCI